MAAYARSQASANLASSSHNPLVQHMPSQRRKFVADLSQCLFDFVMQLLPTSEELAVKEDVRKLLERLIRTIEHDSRLLSFGSTANGFSLRNSDMDLCCLIDSEERLSASDLVTMVGDLLERETKFHVKTLPHARIPIVKLSLDPSPGLPLGIACDIGFENRLALENTRLLLCYSLVDPARVRILVLFLKVWSKRRKINSPYKGTLSSYGYVLLVIYFLVHVKNPPVLPNLQQIPPLRPIAPEDYHMGDRNIWFFDDIDLLRQKWQSSNSESVAELLIDFFRYYARDFTYNTGVASVRAGLLKKDLKGWQNDNDPRFKDSRERNRLCIEDPFETEYNVARCVTKDGLYLIRGEFMRACRILAARPERAYVALAQLCEERDENIGNTTVTNQPYVPPRLSIPPQTPYSVGSNSLRPKGAPESDRLSPPRQPIKQETKPPHQREIVPRSPPEHMAPKRSKWTSPPPPEAPDDDRTSFETRLDMGLSLATAPSDAREQDKAYLSSSSNSEILSDDGEAASDIAPDDEVNSVRSFGGEPSVGLRPDGVLFASGSVPHRLSDMLTGVPTLMTYHTKARALDDSTPTPSGIGPRGRRTMRPGTDSGYPLPPVAYSRQSIDVRNLNLPARADGPRRSSSGPTRITNTYIPDLPAMVAPLSIPLPTSPITTATSSPPTIFYETNPQVSSPISNSPIGRGRGSTQASPQFSASPFTLYQQYYIAQGRGQPEITQGILSLPSADRRIAKPMNSLSMSTMQMAQPRTRPMHAHNNSSSTITGPSTPGSSSFTFSHSTINAQESPPGHSPTRMRFLHHPSIPQDLARRQSLGSGTPTNTISLSTPPSSSSSRSGSAGSISPVSSTSPRTAELNSPLSLSPPATGNRHDQPAEPQSRRPRVESAKFLGPIPLSSLESNTMVNSPPPLSPTTAGDSGDNSDDKLLAQQLGRTTLTTES